MKNQLLKEELATKTELRIGKVIDLWMKYCWNYRVTSFTLANGDTVQIPAIIEATSRPTHIAIKWKNKASEEGMNGTKALSWLWYELDAESKEIFGEWLINNYEG